MADLGFTHTRTLRVLHAIWVECSGQVMDTVQTSALRERLDLEQDMVGVDIDAELKLLKPRGLVDYWLSGAGITSVFLTPDGRNAAEEFDATRKSLTARRKQLRHDYLAWLYEQIEENDRHPTYEDFLATAPHFLGEPYTPSDLEKVGVWLRENGFIRGDGAWQYHAPLRPELTEKGRWTMEHGRSPNDPPPMAGSNISVNGNANIAVNSHDFTQQIVQSPTWITDASNLLDSVDQALPTLSDNDQVSALVEETRAALAESAPHPSKVKKAMGALGDFVGRAGSGALGGVLAKQIADFIATLS